MLVLFLYVDFIKETFPHSPPPRHPFLSFMCYDSYYFLFPLNNRNLHQYNEAIYV